jgi:hypothetical protein
MTVARRRQMARLERLAAQFLEVRSAQIRALTPIDIELQEMDIDLLTRDECIELSCLCDIAEEAGSDSSALSPADCERFRELVAKGTPKK